MSATDLARGLVMARLSCAYLPVETLAAAVLSVDRWVGMAASCSKDEMTERKVRQF